MKVTFEGKTFGEVLDQMKDMMLASGLLPVVQGPGPEAGPRETTVNGSGNAVATADADTAEEKISPKLAPADKMAKVRAAKKAKAAAPPKPEPEDEPEEEPEEEDKAAAKKPAKAAAAISPAEMVALRTKTIEELQAAYAAGQQKEVFELLARFGDGAKSFRELKPEAFLPIREAIDNGALT